MSGAAMNRARAGWGEAAPDWVLALATACDESSQAAVARRLGYSPTAVSTTLKGDYGADLSRLEAAVRGAFMAATVGCPVIGEIGADLCAEHQRRPYANTNPTRIALHRACRSGCIHSKHAKGG
jgi:hypothetical protein